MNQDRGERPQLNGIFHTHSVPMKAAPDTNQKVIEAAGKLIKPARRERSDKLKDIKFPVTPSERQELRRRAIEMGVTGRNETISNTKLLILALNQLRLYPEWYPPLVYKDSKQYMHVKPTGMVFKQIEELALQWNCSIRCACHRLLMNYIFKGEVILRGIQIQSEPYPPKAHQND
ncbi:hypothetical protein ACFPYJ_18230 [Paenibacillus solisilvae]|uniref:ProQ/FinO domain-containing protein n=1 Tax=Paenibacillus solisilvae TaxID=2486751 RepID=A0ABW0W000_9BACL